MRRIARTEESEPMDLQLKNKVALVSGSTAGIGLSIASQLAAEGAEVVVSGRTQARVDEAIAQIRKTAPEARLRGIAADLGTAAGCDAAIAALPDVDILVNNLGIFTPLPFAEIPDAAWHEILEANLMSGVRLSRHYLPRMLARKTGRIVFISSESAVNIPTEMIHYGVTKTAQAALARGLADLTAHTAVTVNTILAGPTRSEGVERFLGELAQAGQKTVPEVEADFFKTARPTSLLQRFATTDEIAAAVVFVASPLAAAINGAALRVEGGLVRSVF